MTTFLNKMRYLCRKIWVMEKKKEIKKGKRPANKQVKETSKEKKVSKTWLAALANRGTGEILDMKAVLK